MVSTLPQDQDRSVTRWTLDEMVTALLETPGTDAIGRSSIWRILEDVDLKPLKSEYWLNSHDEGTLRLKPNPFANFTWARSRPTPKSTW